MTEQVKEGNSPPKLGDQEEASVSNTKTPPGAEGERELSQRGDPEEQSGNRDHPLAFPPVHLHGS